MQTDKVLFELSDGNRVETVVVNDNFVGNIRVIPAGDYEPFNDTVKKFSVKC